METPLTRKSKISRVVVWLLVFHASILLVFWVLYIRNIPASSEVETKKVPVRQEERIPQKKRVFPPPPRALAETENIDLGTTFLSMQNMEALQEKQEGSDFEKVKIGGTLNHNGRGALGAIRFEFFGYTKDDFFFLTKVTLSANGSLGPIEEYFPIQTREPEKIAEIHTLIKEIGNYINTCGGNEKDTLKLFCGTGHYIGSHMAYCRVMQTKEGALGLFVFVPEKQMLFLHPFGQEI